MSAGQDAAREDAPVKVIVFGSRTWDEPTTVKHRLRLLPPGSTIVHGQSPGGGADFFGDVYGRALGFRVIPVPINGADRRRARAMGKPRMAPILRNVRIGIEHPDADYAIGFWDGKTRGSKHMRDVCENFGICVEIIAPAAVAGAQTRPVRSCGLDTEKQ